MTEDIPFSAPEGYEFVGWVWRQVVQDTPRTPEWTMTRLTTDYPGRAFRPRPAFAPIGGDDV